MWMRSSQVVRASCGQCKSRNCPRFDPSILRHSEIWGTADEAVLNNVHYKKKAEKFPLKKNSVLFHLASIFSLHFAYFRSFFRFRFFLGQAIFRFIFVSLRFFRFFSLIWRSFSLQIFAVSLRCESSEIMFFFPFQAKWNFRFNFNFRFRSENEGAPYSPHMLYICRYSP